MPVENERKFIINPFSEDEVDEFAYDCQTIGQGYTFINDDIVARVRYNTGDYFFTYKHYINGECIEIETEISQLDFHKLWPQATNKINKYRYLLKNEDNVWEIDYLYDTHGVYIAIAEIEFPEGKFVQLPDFVRRNLIYSVPKHDSRFQNCNLHDRKHVESFLKGIKCSV